MTGATKNARAAALMKVKEPCKEYGFADGMLTRALALGRTENKLAGNND
jgi:hypothetical protein